jgi:hypothetical protein
MFVGFIPMGGGRMAGDMSVVRGRGMSWLFPAIVPDVID